MDGREGMAMPGSASYYLSRGGGIGGSGSLANVQESPSEHSSRIHYPTPSFKNPINPFEANVNLSGKNASTFHLESPPTRFYQAVTADAPSSELPVKKKRGRPRKYGSRVGGADMALGLSPSSASNSGEKGRRGRPPGTGWKQKLAPLGEWMNSSAGVGFTPHVLHIGVGEDIAGKILAFAQQRPRALCIMSANGSISAMTLRQPTKSGGAITYEGRFEILCLSGSYLVTEIGSPGNRTGGISISVCSPDGLIIGGAIGGKLTAANSVQVIACSFSYGNTKVKSKADSFTKEEKNVIQHSESDKSLTPVASSTLSFTPNSGPGY